MTVLRGNMADWMKYYNKLAELEEVVHCKNCEYLVNDDSRWFCSNLEFDIDFNTGEKPDGFCAWGEKKLLTEKNVELFKRFDIKVE